MAVAFGSLSSGTYGGRTDTTVTAPTGISDGDVLIAQIFLGAGGPAPSAPTPPAGWTQIGSDQTAGSGGFNARITIWYKVASGESGDYTWTHALCSSQGAIFRYTGGHATPINTSSSNSGSPATTTRTWDSVTTTVNDCMLVAIGWDWGDNANNETPPTGFTERLDNVLFYCADAIQASAGASGNLTNTCNSDAGDPRGAWLVAIASASGGSSQDITGAKVTNTNSFGTSVTTTTVGVTGSKVTNTSSFKTAVVTTTRGLTGVIFTNNNSFGTSTVSSTYNVTGAKLSNTSTFGAATIGVGAVTISSVKFTNNPSFKAAVIGSSYSVTGSKLSNTNSFGTAIIAIDTDVIEASKFTNTNTFGTASITVSGASILSNLFTNSNTFGRSTISHSLYYHSDGSTGVLYEEGTISGSILYSLTTGTLPDSIYEEK